MASAVAEAQTPPPQFPSDQILVNNQPNPPKEKNPKKGDPVLLLTGEFEVRATDLEIAGRGMDFQFTRYYRSRTATSSTLGTHWNFNWNQFIVLEYHDVILPPGGDGPVMDMDGGVPPVGVTGAYYYNGSGRIDPFYLNVSAPTGWQSPHGYFGKLRHEGDLLTNPTAFILRSADGTIFTFDVRDWNQNLNDPFVQGVIFRLSRIEDRMGNAITIVYEQTQTSNPYSRIDKILDTFGREINFNYKPNGLLDSIVDFTNRTVRFTHDSYISGSGTYYNLTGVTSPSVQGTPTGNNYAMGKTVHYEYDIANPLIARRYDLTKIYDAQEWQNGNGPSPVPYVQNTYDNLSRVTSQLYGGTNTNGVPAGGYFTYKYYTTANQWNWFFETSRTFVVDPNGNVELHLFDGLGSDRLTYQFTGRLNPISVPPSISVSITPADPQPSNSLSSPPQWTLRGASDPGCFYTRRDFNSDGLVVDERTAGVRVIYSYDTSTDNFQRGNLIKTERRPVPDDLSPGIITTTAYEPIYVQVRATIDPRGNSGGYTPPNGGNWSPGRYMTKQTFDYQEDSVTSGPIGDLVANWVIDMNSSSQAAWFPPAVLPTITQDSNLGDQNGDGTGKTAGNVIKTRYPDCKIFGDPVNSGSTNVTQSASIVVAYNQYSLPTTVTDPENNITSFEYNQDPTNSNGPHGPNYGGFINKKSSPEGVQETFGYDALGRVTHHVNGRGFASNSVYNELGQLVQDTNARQYVRQYLYNWNDLLVEERIPNKVPQFNTTTWLPTGSEADGSSGSMITNYYLYDILNHKITDDIQVDGTNRIVTRYRYDRVGNQVLTLFPESMNGAGGVVSANVSSRVYDERNLVWHDTLGGISTDFQTLSAHADIPERSALATYTDALLVATTKTDYDASKQVTKVTDPMGHAATYAYDNLARRIRTTDALGNYEQSTPDIAGQVIQVDQHQNQGGAPDTILAKTWNAYDERGRVYQCDEWFTSSTSLSLPEGQLTPGDQKATTRYVFNKNNCVLQTVNDNKNYVTNTYDGLSRLRTAADSVKVLGSINNVVTYTYDKEDNLITTAEAEVSPSGAVNNYISHLFYDQLNRLTAHVEASLSTNNLGLTMRSLYDSRGNVVFSSDAKSTTVTTQMSSLDPWNEHSGISGLAVNDHGNTTIITYDDASRMLTTVSHMRDPSVGGAPLAFLQAGGDGKITISRSYDRNSRVRFEVDDNGNSTETTYDVLNRPYLVKSGDLTTDTLIYNRDGLVTRRTDANGSVVRSIYDASHRLTNRSITLAGGVIGTTSEVYTYDGLNRLLFAENKVGTTTTSTVSRTYDSLSHVIQETINGKLTTSLYDGLDSLAECTYPGGRHLIRSRDARERIATVQDTAMGNVAQYQYVGRNRVYARDYLNGTRLSPLYDEVRRITTTSTTRISNGSVVDQQSYQWDRSSNKIQRTNVVSGLTHQYLYDSQYRLAQSIRLVVAPQTITYNIDGTNNRVSVTGGMGAGNYTMSSAVGDLQVNQYTTTPTDSRTYDNNGNLIQIQPTVSGARNALIAYDYRNQMTDYTNLISGFHHTYLYDALGRRIRKTVNAGSASQTVTNYYYLGWQVVEEQDELSVTKATYVYGNDLDEVLSMRRNAQDYYYHADDLGNVMRMTNATAGLAESFEYGDYGALLDPASPSLLPKSGSTDRNPCLFSAARLDSETGLYYMRTRYMDPAIGRFTTRDSIGIWGDRSGLGNGTTYAADNPWTFNDPMGTKCNKKATKKPWPRGLPGWEKQKAIKALKRLKRILTGVTTRGNTASHGSVSGNAPTGQTQGDTSYHGTGSRQGGSNPYVTVQCMVVTTDSNASATDVATSESSSPDGNLHALIDAIGDAANSTMDAYERLRSQAPHETKLLVSILEDLLSGASSDRQLGHMMDSLMEYGEGRIGDELDVPEGQRWIIPVVIAAMSPVPHDDALAAGRVGKAVQQKAKTELNQLRKELQAFLADRARGGWEVFSAHAEKAVGKAWGKAVSIEQGFKHIQSGVVLWRHTIVGRGRELKESIRNFSKFGNK